MLQGREGFGSCERLRSLERRNDMIGKLVGAGKGGIRNENTDWLSVGDGRWGEMTEGNREKAEKKAYLKIIKEAKSREDLDLGLDHHMWRGKFV